MLVLELIKTGEAVYLDLAAAIQRYGKEQAHKRIDASDEKLIIKLGAAVVANKYGNLSKCNTRL
jgi:succinate dehydrogenase / fumarate reductase flavoprotein subunit